MRIDPGLLLVAVLWGLNPLAMKFGMDHLPVNAYNALRLLFAAAGTLMFASPRSLMRAFGGRQWPGVLMCSACLSLFYIWFTKGVHLTTTGNTALMSSLLPVSVLALNLIMRTERIHSGALAGIVASLAGVAVYVWSMGGMRYGSDDAIGLVYLFLAQLAFAGYTVASVRPGERLGNHVVNGASLFVAFLVVAVGAIPEWTLVDWTAVSPVAWSSAFFSGFFAVAIANWLWLRGTSRLGSLQTSLYNNLPLFVTAISGYFVLNETVNIWQMAGMALVVAGVVLASGWKKHREVVQ